MYLSSWILFGGGGVIGNLNFVVVLEGDCIGIFTVVFTATWLIKEKSSCECKYLLLVKVGQGRNFVKFIIVLVAL
jgi:hypothetical protein